ncbi:MAG: hypothetical protein KAV99_04530 [Candidatus Latescibacteria bacterium]|nr:hypothetical protein [Candidatus Latescibacterota bacterium]
MNPHYFCCATNTQAHVKVGWVRGNNVRWHKRKNLDELKDRPVILEVTVREGEMYALRFSYQVALVEQPHEQV